MKILKAFLFDGTIGIGDVFGVEAFYTGKEGPRKDLVEDTPVLREHSGRVEGDNFPPTRHQKKLKKPVPVEGVV